MTKFEQLQKDLKEIGFEIDDNSYILDRVTYQTIQVNGQIYKQPEHHKLIMNYIGEGCEVDDSDCDIEGTEFYEFEIGDDENSTVICIENLEDLKSFINV